MGLFNLGDIGEGGSNLRKTLFFCRSGKGGIDLGPLFVFAIGSGFEVIVC